MDETLAVTFSGRRRPQFRCWTLRRGSVQVLNAQDQHDSKTLTIWSIAMRARDDFASKLSTERPGGSQMLRSLCTVAALRMRVLRTALISLTGLFDPLPLFFLGRLSAQLQRVYAAHAVHVVLEKRVDQAVSRDLHLGAKGF